jgi:hypothetical protein
MPIFMDRHDVRGATAEDIAAFVSLGERRLKRFSEAVSVFRFEWRT